MGILIRHREAQCWGFAVGAAAVISYAIEHFETGIYLVG